MDFWIASHFPHTAIIHQQFVVLDYVILVHSRPIDTLYDSLLPTAAPTLPPLLALDIGVGEPRYTFTLSKISLCDAYSAFYEQRPF